MSDVRARGVILSSYERARRAHILQYIGGGGQGPLSWRKDQEQEYT
jgi:hypothetical protein